MKNFSKITRDTKYVETLPIYQVNVEMKSSMNDLDDKFVKIYMTLNYF